MVKKGFSAELLLADSDPLVDVSILQGASRLPAITKDGAFHKAPPVWRETRPMAAE